MVLWGCSAAGSDSIVQEPEENSATSLPVPDQPSTPNIASVDGPLLVGPTYGEAYGEAEIVGQLINVDSCLAITDPAAHHDIFQAVVWPARTTWSPDTSTVILPDGSVATAGSTLAGTGGFYPTTLASVILGIDLDKHLGECLDLINQVAIFNPNDQIEIS